MADNWHDELPYVVLPTGLPASGKTTLSQIIAGRRGVPVLSADSIKESLFDSVGYSTLAWSEFLTIVARDMALRLLPDVGPCIFDVLITPADARSRLVPMVKTIIEIHCNVTPQLAWRRFIERARSGNRHPGHLDSDISYDFFSSTLEPQSVDAPFDLGGPLLEIDTTDFSNSQRASDWASAEIAKLSRFTR